MKASDALTGGGQRPVVEEPYLSLAEDQRLIPEKLITLKVAADRIGLPAWKLNRAAKQNLFPTYCLLNSRRLVKLSEVLAAIEASRQGSAE